MLKRVEFPLRSELLARYPVLRSLPAPEFERLLAEGALRKAAAGTVLFDEAQPCTGFPFVLEGAVGVSKYGDGGREIQLYRVEAGDSCILSSSCLLGSVAYNAHGVALADTTLFVLPVPTFQRLLGASSDFRGYVFSLFAGRMADLMQTVDEVAFKRLDERLARLLLRRGPRIQATHQQLADELGSVREIVSRIMRGFAEQGLVKTGREQIEVLDRAGLARIAGTEA
ncbi:MAG: Crp/Fnr family transcriptional regulator [Steroidobacteraceae bacterium]|jgi:CRP/FNR family transcriptional regulator|nr:Crp/Fnr family transcriptional regulator [Steroidobacteraceae bacterium]